MGTIPRQKTRDVWNYRGEEVIDIDATVQIEANIEVKPEGEWISRVGHLKQGFRSMTREL